MEAAMSDKKTVDMKIEGKVVDVCKKKGCWMTLQMPNGDPMRVTFKDYAFFMPMDIVGKNVVLDGIKVSIGINYDECPNLDGMSTFKSYSIHQCESLICCKQHYCTYYYSSRHFR
ncbi:MAG: DUF4920 domain-containing protein [Pedobacter sp.]|nr:MAG: DUF4920 domain-containing protein [Pedobacter sp.]